MKQIHCLPQDTKALSTSLNQRWERGSGWVDDWNGNKEDGSCKEGVGWVEEEQW